ncbi:MAG: SpoIIE family protein phosphatase, partial [Rhodothermales bacterium]|nr:SpoIIE family protein phosphatase [Rhodothermales bacterium]
MTATRTGRVLLGLFFVVCFVLGAAYHLAVHLAGQPPAFGVELLYNVVVLFGYGAWWLLLSYVMRRRQATPIKIFWTTLVLGVVLFGMALAVLQIGRVPGVEERPGFNYVTGVPLTLATVFKMNVLSLLEATFFFVLLLRFRDLVLFKRTKASQRNWYLMLALMLLAALTAFMQPPEDEFTPLLAVALVPAVAFMVVNSFRLSWIVHLSFKEKVTVIGLAVLLLATLAASLGPGLSEGLPLYLAFYHLPLRVFILQAIIFGILYCTTALLSLLFHLPTTSDFQRKTDEIAAMHSLTTLIGQVFDLERLVGTIAASPVEAGSADAAFLAVADPETGSLRPRVVATHNIAPALVAELIDTAAFYEEVAATGEPLLVEQAPADHRIDAQPGDGIASMLVAPLRARDELLGALFVTREVTHGFERDDIEAIAVFAAQAALALDNARLFEEQIERERLSRELAIAREVQHKLLPQRLPHLGGVSLAASSVSAHEVGGDYYDFARIDEHRMAFIIADVSGKGTSAAFYMAEMQGVFQAMSHLTPDPCDFLSHANRALAGTLEKNVFISVIYGLLDTEREELQMARAGHCPAALIRLDGTARYLRSQGLGLGLDHGPLFRKTLAVERLRLAPGDVFALYTDGVVESRDGGGQEYGYDRLLASLRAHRHEDADVLHAALLSDLDAFLGPESPYDDDLTLSPRALQRRLHLRQRASGSALWVPGRGRRVLPARPLPRRQPARDPGARKRARADLAREPD